MFKNRKSLYFIPLLSQKGIFPVPKQFQQFITLFLLFPKYLYDQKSSLQYSRSHWLQSWSPENAQPAFTPHSSCILFFFKTCLFERLGERETERTTKKERDFPLFTPQMTSTAAVGPGWSEEPANPPGFPMWLSGAHLYGPYFTAFPDIFSGSWTRIKASRTQPFLLFDAGMGGSVLMHSSAMPASLYTVKKKHGACCMHHFTKLGHLQLSPDKFRYPYLVLTLLKHFCSIFCLNS